MNVLVLNRKHGSLPRGTVCKDGEAIGRVFAHDRKTGHAGVNAGYWTATPAYPSVPLGEGTSLGTRFTSRRQAEAAIREFDAAHPAVALAARDPFCSLGFRVYCFKHAEAWRKGRKARYGF